ncbi:MAG TPA: hypothetical protein VN192_05695 [Flavobacterium sp.]|nr:hypothetical protein [Flavobacterium sp.]
MKAKLLIAALLISNFNYSQNIKKDYLVTKSNDIIYCKIIELNGKHIKFIEGNGNSSTTKNINNFLEVNITDSSVIDNPLGITIEQPEKGFAYVYLYRPYMYKGSALNCKVEHNGTSLVNLQTDTYYLHKVRANETHVYKWEYSSGGFVEIEAVDGEIYFIRGAYESVYQPYNSKSMIGDGMKIFLDNPNIAKYLVLTMRKESPTY